MLQFYFFLRQFRLIKWRFFIHSTTPYIHPRLDSRNEPKFSDCLQPVTYNGRRNNKNTEVNVSFPRTQHSAPDVFRNSDTSISRLRFSNKNGELCGEQEQKIHYLCEDSIEKSFPRDHRLSSLGKPRDANR